MTSDAEHQVAPEPSGEDRRQFLRKKSLLPASVITPLGSFDCQVLDLSAGGAKVECTQSLVEGDSLRLMVNAIGTFSGTVIWCREGCFGMRFDADTAKAAALSGSMPMRTPFHAETTGSQLAADSKSNSTAREPIPARISGSLSELLAEINDLRSDFEQATRFTSELTTELLFRAYLVFQQAVQDSATAATLRGEVERLGLKPSSRSRLQHLAVDVAFPRTKISPSLRTLYAKAIVGGHAREYTARQFREAVETGSSGKGGINELARPLGNVSGTEPKVAIAEAHSTPVSTEFAPADNGKGDFEGISLSESVRKRLASEGLVEGAEFLVVVRVIGTHELQGVEYLGPCHRASDFPAWRAWPSAGLNTPVPAK